MHSLALSPDGDTLLAAGTGIRLWNLESKKSPQKWIGHTNSVRGLVFTAQGTAFVSFASEDRFVDLWSLQNTENENALAVLALDNNPISIDTHSPFQDRPSVSGFHSGIFWYYCGLTLACP